MAHLMFVLAVLTRFIPHPWNFSPVFGALLFGGAKLPKRDFLWFPLAVLAVSDVLLTTQVYGLQMHWTYGLGSLAFAAVALIGRWLCREVTVRRFTAAAFAGPTAFYLISNFSVWLGFRTYPPTWEGFVACYVAGLPYYRNSLLASILFGAVLFGFYEYYARKTGRGHVNVTAAARLG